MVLFKQFLSNVLHHLFTIFLLIKSDIKTVVIPSVPNINSLRSKLLTFIYMQVITSAYLAPLTNFSRVPHILFWLLLQIIHCDLAGQIYRLEEDRLNKPYRPLVTGRLSLHVAIRLRWVLALFNLIQSSLHGVELFYASVANAIVYVLYDDLEFDKAHWSIRQLLLGFGHIPYFYGATLIASESRFFT